MKLIMITIVIFLSGCGFLKGKKSYEVKNSQSYNSGPVVLFGDSLAYGHGASSEMQSLSGCFSAAFKEKVVNLGRNGATSSDVVSQISQVTKLKPSMILVSLGGNDVLRRVSSQNTLDNMRQIFKKFVDEGSVVLYLGLKPPQSFFMGKLLDVKRLEKIKEIAREEGVLFIEDAFQGLWKDSQYMYDDIHPNDKGYAVICNRLVELLGPHYP